MPPPRMSKRLSQQAPRLSIVMAGDEPQERKHESTVREFCSNHMKTLVTLVMIFGTIICIVLIVMVHKWRFEGDKLEEIEACLDVAVIGAGLSGSYASWRMRLDTKSHVHMFELADTAGGRIRTQRFPEYDDPKLKAELGALYYFPQRHPLLNRSIHALKLTPTGYYPPNHDPPTYYFRGTHLKRTDFRAHSPYHLTQEELGQTPEELKRYYTELHLGNVHANPLSTKYKFANLYDMGYWNFLDDVASRDAFNFIEDGARWKSHVSNGNAALMASVDLHTWEQHSTLAEGMDALPRAMAEEFENSSERHVVHYNKRLVCIEREQWGDARYYRLMYQHTETVDGVVVNITKSSRICANKIILAMSPAAMKRIIFMGFGEDFPGLTHMIDSVLDPVPALSAYFLFNQTWWNGSRPEKQHVITDLPMRRFRFIGKARLDSKENREERSPPSVEYGYLFLVASPDLAEVSYFDAVAKNRLMSVVYSGCNLTIQGFKNLKRQIARVQDVKDASNIPDPIRTYIQDWRDTPSGAAWHMWKTGVNWDLQSERMRKPFPKEEIYLVGSDFCPGNCQFWAEGALKSVELLLEEYFPKAYRSPLETKDFHSYKGDAVNAESIEASIPG